MNDANPKFRFKELSSDANKTRMWFAAAVTLIIISVYSWGEVRTRNQLADQEAQYQQRITAMDTQLQETQRELEATRNRNHLLMARTDLYRAAAELDRRNFGTANTRLQEAEAALKQVDTAGGGIDAAKLNALRSSIAGLNFNVATDLQDQRNQVLDLAARLDEIALEAAGTAVAQ